MGFKTSRADPPEWWLVTWAKLQTKYSCCGVYRFTDWLDGLEPMINSCISNEPLHNNDDRFAHITNAVGCGDVIVRILTNSATIRASAYVTATLAVVQVLALIVTLKLWIGYCFHKPKRTSADPSHLHFKDPEACQYLETPIPNEKCDDNLQGN